MPKVLITPTTLVVTEGPWVKYLRDAGFEVVFPKRLVQPTEEELLQELAGVTATLAGSEPYTRSVLDAHPQLRVIARAGVGFDAVDLAAALDHGVAVTIAPGTNQEAVAEHTFALILALSRDIVPQDKAVRTGKWPRRPHLPLRGWTLGIAGLGRIGKAVAVRGAAFGMKLLAHEPYPDKQFVEQYKVKLVPFEQLLKESDYLTVHVPLAAESHHLINKKTLALMKPSAFLINTARGGLVCEADLIEALRNKKLGGAGLDVFEEEPTSANNPLFQFDNVVLTPHAAGTDLTSRDDMAMAAAGAIIQLSRGEWPAEQIVNPEVKSKFRW